MMKLLNFGQAIEAAKQGLKVARTGWNGSGMFAYIVPTEDCEKYEVEKKHFKEESKFIVSNFFPSIVYNSALSALKVELL